MSQEPRIHLEKTAKEQKQDKRIARANSFGAKLTSHAFAAAIVGGLATVTFADAFTGQQAANDVVPPAATEITPE